MIPFTKVHGNGNDFILFDEADCPPIIRDSDFITRLCDRRRGVGGDGVLILSKSDDSQVDFKLDYYNADGSWETLCANGSRCAVRYYLQSRPEQGEVKLRTGAGVHAARLLKSGQIELQILPPVHVTEMQEVEGYRGQHVDSGAPHFAAEVPGLSREIIASDGPAIRYAEVFQPRGVNVNFYERLDDQTLSVMTYEKGVENVVDSCASGSTAACFQAAMTANMKSPIRVINPGGELSVNFDPAWQKVSVTGPAVLVYRSELPDNF